MRTKIRAYRKTNFVLIRKFTDYLHRFFIVLKGGAMEEFTKELLDQLNVDTAFTIGPFAISESVVITWVVMAILVLLSAWLTQGLKVHNPGKKQIVAESIVLWLDKFTISMLGENAKEYSTYISTILLYNHPIIYRSCEHHWHLWYETPNQGHECHNRISTYEYYLNRNQRNTRKRNERLDQKLYSACCCGYTHQYS